MSEERIVDQRKAGVDGVPDCWHEGCDQVVQTVSGVMDCWDRGGNDVQCIEYYGDRIVEKGAGWGNRGRKKREESSGVHGDGSWRTSRKVPRRGRS